MMEEEIDDERMLQLWTDLLQVTGPNNSAFFCFQQYLNALDAITDKKTSEFCESVATCIAAVPEMRPLSSTELQKKRLNNISGYSAKNEDGDILNWFEDEDGNNIGEYCPSHFLDKDVSMRGHVRTRVAEGFYACAFAQSNKPIETDSIVTAMYPSQFLARVDKTYKRLYLEFHEPACDCAPNADEVSAGNAVLRSSDWEDVYTVDCSSQAFFGAVGRFGNGCLTRYALEVDDIVHVALFVDQTGPGGCLMLKLDGCRKLTNCFSKRFICATELHSDTFVPIKDWTCAKSASLADTIQIYGRADELSQLCADLCTVSELFRNITMKSQKSGEVFLLPLAVECKATLAVAHHAKACPVEEVLTLLQVFVNTGVRAFDEYVTSRGQEFKFCGDVARLHLQLNHLKRLV